jgi:hypothetical protein
VNALPHRQTLPESVRAAMCVLDRASEGQAIPTRDIERALRVTGDVGWRHEMHEPVLLVDPFPVEH